MASESNELAKVNPLRPYILIAEDEIDHLNVMANVLSEEGYNVLTATDGKKAFEILQETTKKEGLDKIHAIVSDFKMPILDGAQLLAQVRQSEFSKVPFVILSGRLTRNVVDALIRLGVDGILYKPFHIKSLKEEIEKARKRKEEKELDGILK